MATPRVALVGDPFTRADRPGVGDFRKHNSRLLNAARKHYERVTDDAAKVEGSSKRKPSSWGGDIPVSVPGNSKELLRRLAGCDPHVSADELEEELSACSGDKMVRDYIAFLQGAIEAQGGDSREFLRRVRELADSVSPGAQSQTDVDPAVDSVELSAELTTESEEYALYARGPNGTVVAAGSRYSASFNVSAEINLADDTEVDVFASVQIEVSTMVAVASRNGGPVEQPSDPLALDIDGNGSIDLAQGTKFDLTADGFADTISFVTGKDIFLGLDRNGNGKIDDGGELFGDQHGAANGFVELGKFDSDMNGVIDSHDNVFSQLVGVRANGGAMEVSPLSAFGVKSIGLGYEDRFEHVAPGVTAAQVGRFVTESGEEREAVDLLLAVEA